VTGCTASYFEAPGFNLSTGYFDLSSVFPEKVLFCYLEVGHDHVHIIILAIILPFNAA
jgi:hypothetical protein